MFVIILAYAMHSRLSKTWKMVPRLGRGGSRREYAGEDTQRGKNEPQGSFGTRVGDEQDPSGKNTTSRKNGAGTRCRLSCEAKRFVEASAQIWLLFGT